MSAIYISSPLCALFKLLTPFFRLKTELNCFSYNYLDQNSDFPDISTIFCFPELKY